MELLPGGRADEPLVMRPVTVEGLDDEQVALFAAALLQGTSGKNVVPFPQRDPESPE